MWLHSPIHYIHILVAYFDAQTSHASVAAGIVSSKRFPHLLYIGLNKRDPEVFDMYSLDLRNRKLVLYMVNPGDVTSWLYDYNFKIQV